MLANVAQLFISRLEERNKATLFEQSNRQIVCIMQQIKYMYKETGKVYIQKV